MVSHLPVASSRPALPALSPVCTNSMHQFKSAISVFDRLDDDVVSHLPAASTRPPLPALFVSITLNTLKHKQ